MNNYSNYSDQAVLQTIFDYIEFSRSEEFSKIESIIISFKKAQDQLKESQISQSKELGNKFSTESQPTEVDSSFLDQYSDKNLSIEYPSLIKKANLVVENYQIKSCNNLKCKVNLNLKNDRRKKLVSIDFSLIYTADNKWKIFKIGFPLEDDGE